MRVLRLKDVIQKTGLGRSSLYKFSGLGKFPTATALGGMSVGWKATAINQWIVQRIREREDLSSGISHVTPWAVAITEDDTSENDLKILRIKQVMALTGLARSTVYKYIDERDFPRPIPLSGAAVGWIEAEVAHWLADCFGITEQFSGDPEMFPEVA